MDYERMRVPELRSITKDRELTGYYRLKILELVSLLRASDKVNKHKQSKNLLEELEELKKRVMEMERKPKTNKVKVQPKVVSEAFNSSYKKHRIN